MILKNIKATRDAARGLALNSKKRIFALVGDLGSGKTTFTQAFLRALGVKSRITSPTFLIIRSYKIKNKKAYHMDCYRLKKSKELLDLGFKEITKNPDNVVLIEWADRVKSIIPKTAIWIYFEHGEGKSERKIIIKTKK